ncbi:single-stranded-DNA-specific exonuclease RecJ [Fructilactobacillus florum]|uniref:Single-stranded-DNA-specific exonuclease RecJ n=2 Tax=Fructilactobacillus florum TaxID=640331 RepID=A0A0R2CKR6_9LACO|nr:single-stranded-DNA-specific exonuclease RecJ [Fructilactobacillus florum]KRM91698.1 hypothetical protein FC87_GL000835 [Fructilactobacillus florum DSM 22689 = JCM 16035]
MLDKKYEWKLAASVSDDLLIQQLKEETGLSSLATQLLIRRGYRNLNQVKHYLSPTTADLLDPFDLHDMQKVVTRIETAIAAGEQITVYGDYDADGLTSTAILYETLLEMGAQVNYYIPKRLQDGYGPNQAVFERLIAGGTKLLITVDNGVSGQAEVASAQASGCDVIITDHHELPEQLPDAFAIVHADLSPDYQFKSLSGAGIAFKVATALNDEIPQEKLDLAAIGTIADLVSLTGENRALVQFGLNVVHLTERPGLKALVQQAKVKLNQVNEETIGFQLAPALNSLGRMGDAAPGVDLLTTTDETVAQALAKETTKKNATRKQLVTDIVSEADEQAQSQQDQAILLITGSDWAPGVLGIVASRLKDKYNKPTIVLAKTDDADYKGSGRSISGFNLFRSIEPIHDQLVAFGGHAMAVGLTVSPSQLPILQHTLATAGKEQLAKLAGKPTLTLDYAVKVDDLTPQLIEELQQLSPFGTDNPKPRFLINPINLTGLKQLGQHQEHLKFTLVGKNRQVDAISFGRGPQAVELATVATSCQIAGTLGENEFRGHRRLQVLVDDFHAVGPVILDRRTKRLVPEMFSRTGLYIFFDENLRKQLKPYFTDTSKAVLATELSEIPKWNQAFFVDCPPTSAAFTTALQQLKADEITIYFYKKRYLLDGGMPTRQQYAKLFKFLETHQQIELRSSLTQVAQRLKIDGHLLIFMIQVFSDLGFVTISAGHLQVVTQPKHQTLSTSSSYQHRLQEIDLEKELIIREQSQLMQLIRQAYKS